MTVPGESSDEGRLTLRLSELALPSALDSYLSPRSFSWLGDHQDEAAELAALLHEAAPKLALANLRAPNLTGSGRSALPKARSYEVSDIIRDRLRAAVPMPTGPGQIDWSRLAAIISSELLKFDELSDAAALARLQSMAADSAAAAAGLQAPAPSPRTPAAAGGDMLEINSGGRVIFCLFSSEGAHAPTPPSSLRSSPEKEAAGFMDRAMPLQWPDNPGEGGNSSSSSSSAVGAAAAGQPGLCTPAGDGSAVLAASMQAAEDPSISGGLLSEPSLWVGQSTGSSPLHDDRQQGLAGVHADASTNWSSDYAEERLQQLQAMAAKAQQLQQRLADGGASSGTGASHSSSSSSSPICSASSSPSSMGRSEVERSPASFTFSPAPAAAAAADGGPASPACMPVPGAPALEGCLILKFVSSRLLCQSEQFAAELTRHVGLCAPDSRILRQKGSTEQEWREAYEAASALRDRFPDLHEEMTRNSCCLVMEFIPGSCLFKHPAAFSGERLQQTAEDLGRLFTLDMLLGNADRLHCRELAWRGNPENILYATSGRWAGRAVAIDAVVQRRPPGGLMSVEDSSCERLTELALNDAEVAGSLLRQALQPCSSQLCASWDAATLRESAAAFQRGLKAALDAAVTVKGLLEMMFDVTAGWIDSFLEDIEAGGWPFEVGGGSDRPVSTPRGSTSTSRRASSAGGNNASPLLLSAAASTTAQTMRIRQINHEAQRNDSVGEKVAHWKGVFREKGEELRTAVEEWQAKRSAAGAAEAHRLTTAFLDGTHPVVDVYELKVRLEHMLQRLRVLQQATLTGRPCRLMPRLYLSGAVEASSHHLLHYLGITHILNATEDLLLPEEGQGFVTLRCPLRDIEEEDISPHLPDASAFIDEGLASGGSVLVHCHAGKSRSCSLVLAWLMTRRRWPLNRAMEFLRRVRPEAAPNAGYLAALLRLEEGLFGRQTVKMKKTKPEPRSCPVCGEKVGLSADSVRVHLRLKHPGAILARSGREGSQDSGSDNWADLLGSPTGSSPRSHALHSSPGSGSMSAAGSGLLPSPRAAALAEAVQQQGRQQQQQQQQQQHAIGQNDLGQEERQQQQLWPIASIEVAPVATSRKPGSSAASTEAAQAAPAHGIPDSPPSMAAVLRAAEAEGGLTEGDAEEFLSAAAGLAEGGTEEFLSAGAGGLADGGADKYLVPAAAEMS